MTSIDGLITQFNTLRSRQNGWHFTDDIFNCLFFNENVWISIKISLKFVPKGPINNIPALVWIMAWRRSGDKPLSEPVMVSLPMHICATRPQWVNMLRLFIAQRCPQLILTYCCTNQWIWWYYVAEDCRLIIFLAWHIDFCRQHPHDIGYFC